MKVKTLSNFCQSFVLAVIVMVSFVCTGFAQQTTTKDWTFGYEAFNLLIQESGIEICDNSEWANLQDDEKFIISINQTPFFDRSRTVSKVPSLLMCSNGTSLNALFRPRLGVVPPNRPEDYFLTTNCPIVRPRSTQDVFFGVHEIICNTPGFISEIAEEKRIDEQFFPATVRPNRRGGFRREGNPVRRRFSVMTEDPLRRIWVADPLLFTNQMIFKADNLRFADNSVRWLSDNYRRKKVLLLIGGLPQPPVDPSDLDILTPIPTHAEVIEAMSKLPTEEIAEFANSVVQVSEDENIYNDLAHQFIDKLKDGQINRLLLFAVFASCCTIGLMTYFWQRRVLRRTASVTAGRRQRNLSKRVNDSGASERQAAASMLLNSFCLEVANRRLADWPEFPTPIISQQRVGPAVKATNEMADAFWRLRTKPKTYWTKETLMKLEQATDHWRQLVSEDQITIEPAS